MPIYEYTCRACGAGFEKRLRSDERLNEQECPSCGKVEAAFHMSAPAIVGASDRGATDMGYCPGTGQACGCSNAIRN
jgi:putative FmdB family regulatory protein